LTAKTDPSLYSSGFERNALDRYWTGAQEAAAIARRIPAGVTTIWEPCAGRGDLVKVLQDFGYQTFASDIDLSEFDPSICQAEQCDFLKDTPEFVTFEQIDMIVTNPPFRDNAERVVRRALEYQNIRAFAFLLRSEWNSAKSRVDLFEDQPFMKEIILTWRPRWDWWFRDKPEASPRHTFSWMVWDRAHLSPSTQEWARRKE